MIFNQNNQCLQTPNTANTKFIIMLIHKGIFRFCLVKAAKPKVYTQIAFKGDQFYKALAHRAFKVQYQEIIQTYTMFQLGILPAHHEYISKSCVRLLSFQKQLSLKDIIQVLRICAKYNVNNLAIIKHLENQLYCRYEKEILDKIMQKKEYDENKKKEMFKILQTKSKDYFRILTDEFKDETGQTGKIEPVFQNNVDKPAQPLPTTSLQEIAKAAIQKPQQKIYNEFTQQLQALTLDQVCHICNYLIGLQSQQTRLLQLFQEYFKICKAATPYQLVTFFRTNSYVCNKNQQQYLNNKDLYLKRSLKTLRKYQQSFHTKIIPLLKQSAKQIQLEKFAQIYKQISQYTLKKRSLKRDYLKIFVQKAPTEYSILTRQLYDSMKKMLGGDVKLQKILAQKEQKLIQDLQNKELNIPAQYREKLSPPTFIIT